MYDVPPMVSILLGKSFGIWKKKSSYSQFSKVNLSNEPWECNTSLIQTKWWMCKYSWKFLQTKFNIFSYFWPHKSISPTNIVDNIQCMPKFRKTINPNLGGGEGG